MKYTEREFDLLTKKYGGFGGWAIWDYKNQKDTSIINENLSILNTKYIGVGLNISAPIGTWENFRIGRNDRKLKYTFNDTKFRGFYLTDLIKNEINANSTIILGRIKRKEIDIQKHVHFFTTEMNDVKIDDETIFLLFGKAAQELFYEHYQKAFPNLRAINCTHYSMRGTDKNWVENTWQKLGVHLDYDVVQKKY